MRVRETDEGEVEKEGRWRPSSSFRQPETSGNMVRLALSLVAYPPRCLSRILCVCLVMLLFGQMNALDVECWSCTGRVAISQDLGLLPRFSTGRLRIRV